MTKKCYLKNDKVEYILLYHCLNDENHTQIVSPVKKNLIRPHIYIYINWESLHARLNSHYETWS